MAVTVQPRQGNPAIMVLTIVHSPGGESVVGSAIDVLSKAVGGRVSRNQDGAVEIPWTDVTRVGIHEWFRMLIGCGFNTKQITAVAGEMDKTPVATTRPGAVRLQHSMGAIPSGYLMRIDNLEHCSENFWAQMTDLPGAFFLLPSGRPMPIHGSWAKQYQASKLEHPSPVYVSAIHIDKLAALLPSVAEQRLTIRKELGLDYPMYAPEQFVIPGIDPETKHPYTLWKHQAEAVSKAVAMKRSVLVLPVGLGKTLAGIVTSETWMAWGQIDRTIVTVPKSLAEQWQGFLMTYYGRTSVIAGDTAKERAKAYMTALQGNVKYIIIGLDAWKLREAQTLLAPLLGPRTAVIGDECDFLAYEDTARANAVLKLLDGVRATPSGDVQYPQLAVNHRLFLTGTLVRDRVPSIYGQILLLGYHVWNTREEFERRYFERETVPTKRILPNGERLMKEKVVRLNPAMLPELTHIVNTVGYYKSQDDAGIVLPPLRKATIPIEPTGIEATAYKIIHAQIENLMKQVVATDDMAATGQLAVLERLKALQENVLALIAMERAFSCDPALLVVSANGGCTTAQVLVDAIGRHNLIAMSPGSKMRYMLAWLRNFLSGSSGKVLIYTSFERVMAVLKALATSPPANLIAEERETLLQLSTTAQMFHGGLTTKQRGRIIQKFLTDSNCRVLFSTDAGGRGLNLQGAANFLIHYDEPLQLDQYEQREGRLYRPGQKLPVFIMSYMLAPSGELRDIMASMALAVGKMKYPDPRLRSLLLGKAKEKETFMTGLKLGGLQ